MDQWQKHSMLSNLYFIQLKASTFKFEDTLMVAINGTLKRIFRFEIRSQISQGSSYLYVCILNFVLPLNILSHEMDTNFEIHVRENTRGSINTRHFLKSWF